MRPECRTKIIIALVVLCLQIGLVRTQFTYAQEPALQPGRGAVPPAKRGGYILVGPMGFNVRGRYGIPMGPMGPGRGIPPKTANSTTPPAQPDANPAPKPKTSLFFDPNDPPNLRELRERDVMNVLDMVRKEFNVDECRIYLMGHSMGGTGTRYLGVKYSSIWAALGPIAPAASGLDPDLLKSIPDMPVVLVQGDADEMVPIADTRKWADKLKELKMTYVYDETPGLNSRSHHRGRVAECIRLFRQHSKPATH